MVKARGRIRLFGAGLWRVGELQKAPRLEIRVRYLGAKDVFGSDVMAETRKRLSKSRGSDWKTVHLRPRKNDEKGRGMSIVLRQSCVGARETKLSLV